MSEYLWNTSNMMFGLLVIFWTWIITLFLFGIKKSIEYIYVIVGILKDTHYYREDVE